MGFVYQGLRLYKINRRNPRSRWACLQRRGRTQLDQQQHDDGATSSSSSSEERLDMLPLRRRRRLFLSGSDNDSSMTGGCATALTTSEEVDWRDSASGTLAEQSDDLEVSLLRSFVCDFILSMQ